MTQIIHNSNIIFFKENSELPFIPEIYLIRFHQVRHPQPDHLYSTPDNEKWVIKCTMIYRHKLVCMFAVKWYAIFKSTNLPKLKNLTIPCYFNYQLSISFQLPFHYFQKLCLYICHMPEHILNHIFYMYIEFWSTYFSTICSCIWCISKDQMERHSHPSVLVLVFHFFPSPVQRIRRGDCQGFPSYCLLVHFQTMIDGCTTCRLQNFWFYVPFCFHFHKYARICMMYWRVYKYGILWHNSWTGLLLWW